MKIKSFFNLFALVLLLLSTTLYAQISSQQVDSLVNRAMSEFHVPGVGVAIVKDGEIIYNKGFGVRNIEKKNSAVNEHTQFAIASNTKAFTSAALAILVDEGKLTWQTKVRDIIPEFKMYNSYVSDNFTIEDLITHRSGLGLGAGDLMIFPEETTFTIDDILTNFQYFEPVSPFRTKFDYDNLLYIIAGEVIARVSGISWDKFITEKILLPLELNDTYCTYTCIKNKNNVADPHAVIDGVAKPVTHFEFDLKKINGAAGSLYSSVNDISKWMICQMNEGAYGDSLQNTLFSAENHNAMWTIHTVTNGRGNPRYDTHFGGYGYGWFLSDVNGKMSVSHTGGLPGMLSKVIMIPDLKLGVVVLTNASDDGAAIFSAVTQTVVDSYLGLDDQHLVDKYAAYFKSRQENADEVTTAVWNMVEANKDNSVDVNNYIGVYEDKWFGKAEVFMKDDQLWFKAYKSPRLNGAMYFYKANTFAIKWEYRDMNADAFASFCLDENGKAKSIRLKGISPNIDFSFDFQDLDFQRTK